MKKPLSKTKDNFEVATSLLENVNWGSLIDKEHEDGSAKTSHACYKHIVSHSENYSVW